tara:strand:+ start:2758 stop:2916 length:159 start_codon:yes stop_codon:yes gene_type:complete
MTIRTIYEINCSFCNEDSFIHKFAEVGDEPDFCPMCGETTAATLVDDEDWDD